MGENIALNLNKRGHPSPLESDRGWGGGSNKWEIVDGKQTYPEWYHGLAFTGGTRGYAGEPCGIRQATIDFGEPKSFNKVIIWHHGSNHIPKECKLQYWDEAKWIDIDSKRNVDLEYKPPSGYTVTPDTHDFKTVTASKVRYVFDNCKENVLGTLNVHGWIYEFEVFEALPIPEKISDMPVVSIEGIGDKYGSALKKEGVEKVLDLGLMDMGGVPKLADSTGIPVSILYVCKRRAELALSVRIDPAFDALRGKSVEEVMATPSEDLSAQTLQPVNVIYGLKRDIATLMCSMDDAEVRQMKIEQLLMW